MKYRAYLAELLGTFLLALLVRLSFAVTLPVATPVLAALTLGFIVYTLGPVSGAHVNPAVTIGLLSIGRIKLSDAAMYIVAQFIGAALAIVVSQVLLLAPLSASTNVPVALIGEVVGAIVFLIGISSVVRGKSPEIMSGITIGASLLLGILSAVGMGSAGILNPAVALTLNSFSLTYVLGPVLGAVIGVWVYRGVAE